MKYLLDTEHLKQIAGMIADEIYDMDDTIARRAQIIGLMRTLLPLAGEEHVRVLRLVQYEGTREGVEYQIANSLHGTKTVHKGTKREVSITAMSLDTFLGKYLPESAKFDVARPAPSDLEDDLEDETRG